MRPATAAAARRVGALLGREALEFDAPTRTAAEAAAALGCAVAQIAKSILFRDAAGRPVLCLLPGDRQVDEDRLAALLGRPVARADAAYVREATGYPIGGVAPVGHRTPPEVLADPALLDHAEVWVAAGTPHAVAGLPPEALLRLARARLAPLARRGPAPTAGLGPPGGLV